MSIPAELPDVPDEEVIETMRVYGGSFVKALAEAWRYADSENKALIKETWGNKYWPQYIEAALTIRKRKEEGRE